MFLKKAKADPQTVMPAASSDAAVSDLSASLARALRNPLATQTQEQPSPTPAIGEALGAIEAAFFAIDQIRDYLVQASQIVIKAMDISDLAGRSMLAEQYDEMRETMSGMVSHFDKEAAKLVGAQAKNLEIRIGASNYSVQACRLDLSAAGLALSPPKMAFEEMSEIAATLGELDAALSKVDRAAKFYMKDAQFLISKLEQQEQV